MRCPTDSASQRAKALDQVLPDRDLLPAVRPRDRVADRLGRLLWPARARHDLAAVVPVLHGGAGARVHLPVEGRSIRMAMMEYMTTKKDELVGWIRKFSLFPYPFVTACCGMEFMSVSSTLYDTDRFGAALPRFTPRQSDLLMVVGTVSHKEAPILKRVYEQMCEPKWVMAFGACATSGGFYRNYAVVQGIDKIIPVDIYVPGCPPRPETVIDAIMMLQEKISRERHPILAAEQRGREPSHANKVFPIFPSADGVPPSQT